MQRPCLSFGCDRLAHSRGWCKAHYDRWYRHGDVRAAVPLVHRSAPHGQAVSVDDQGYLRRCLKAHPTANRGGKVRVHRMVLYDAIGGGEHRCHKCGCSVSWDYLFPHPRALTVDHIDGDKANNRRENLAAICNVCNPRAGAIEERRRQRLGQASPLPECVLWTGNVRSDGYGTFGRHGYAHRRAWEVANGPIPIGMEVDHTCRVKHCVNAAHLQLLTNREHRQVTRWRESGRVA
jgi:hypothetical protein